MPLLFSFALRKPIPPINAEHSWDSSHFANSGLMWFVFSANLLSFTKAASVEQLDTFSISVFL